MIRVAVKATSPVTQAGLERLLQGDPEIELVPLDGESRSHDSDGSTAEVLRLLAEGLVNKEIASCLNISEHTAKFHVASILGKLGATTRTEAVTLGIRYGLIMI
jgi:DNA-binding CsgD family transcriptional regulator